MAEIKKLISLPQKWYFVRFSIFIIIGILFFIYFSESIGKTLIILSIIQLISVMLVNFFKIITIMLFGDHK